MDREKLMAFLILALDREDSESSEVSRFINDLLMQIEFGKFDPEDEEEE